MIDCVQYRTANSKLFCLLKDTGCSGLELHLLRFWGRHPRAKLSLYTIASVLDTTRLNLRHAIATLVDKDILSEQHDIDGLTTYSLNNSQQIQECIEELSELGHYEIEIMERQLEGEAILV